MPNAAPKHETRAEMWTRWQRETDVRMAQFNASLPSRDASEYPSGLAWGLSIQDRLDRGKM